MHFTEETGVALDSVTFLVFGAVLLGPVLKQVSWQIVVYTVLSLTIVRMLPVALALLGTHARPATVAFIGWFGPRGLASIVFAVIVEDARIPHAAAVATITYLTVALSVFAPRALGGAVGGSLCRLVQDRIQSGKAAHGKTRTSMSIDRPFVPIPDVYGQLARHEHR